MVAFFQIHFFLRKNDHFFSTQMFVALFSGRSKCNTVFCVTWLDREMNSLFNDMLDIFGQWLLFFRFTFFLEKTTIFLVLKCLLRFFQGDQNVIRFFVLHDSIEKWILYSTICWIFSGNGYFLHDFLFSFKNWPFFESSNGCCAFFRKIKM